MKATIIMVCLLGLATKNLIYGYMLGLRYLKIILMSLVGARFRQAL